MANNRIYIRCECGDFFSLAKVMGDDEWYCVDPTGHPPALMKWLNAHTDHGKDYLPLCGATNAFSLEYESPPDTKTWDAFVRWFRHRSRKGAR